MVETESEHINDSEKNSLDSKDGLHGVSPLFSPMSMRRNEAFKSMGTFKMPESVTPSKYIMDE